MATGSEFPSGAPPVFTLTNPPAWMIRSNAERSVHRSRTTGNAFARHGSITIIPQGHDGDWDIAGPIGVSHVFLTEERLMASAEQLSAGGAIDLVPRVGFDDPIAARMMEMLGREAHVGDPSSRLFVEQATDLLCTQLLRGHSTYRTLSATGPRRGLAMWQVRKVSDYMRGHLGAPVGLDDLAGLAGLSRFHFCTAFRQATGATPHEWLTRLRVERAQQLLADPNAKLVAPTIHEQRDALAEHFGIAMQIHGEQLAGRRMRKMGIKYSRFHPEAALVKAEFVNVRSLREWNEVLGKWYGVDAPGVWPRANAADEVNDDLQSCEAAA